MDEPTLIVGLGNPGSEYENTRHNIGFMVIDHLQKIATSTKISKSSFEGELFKSKSHIFLKPMTYMNLSGKSVLSVKNFYKIGKIVVIHDDLDLPFGTLRFKLGGGNGGHNGLKSIDGTITNRYIRVRMGIGRPSHKGEVKNYVLTRFSEDEQGYLQGWIESASDAVSKLTQMNWEDVASRYSLKQSPTAD